MIKVLIVEDSAVVREFLAYILNSDPEIEVVGVASDGEEALEAVARLRPDVITMDINMPKANGFEVTRWIMESHPTPIVIVSGSYDTREVAISFRVMEAGALAALPRPAGIGHPDHEAMARELIQTVKLMSEVKVVRRWPRARNDTPAWQAPAEVKEKAARKEVRLVAIGASTGGPLALQIVLSRLPAAFPVPILIVQHISPGFVQGFVEWLAGSCVLPIQVGAHGQGILPGEAYVAPDGFHMGVAAGGWIVLSRCESENGLCPSVSTLFRSAVAAYGPGAVGVLLSGMGKDGAKELKLMKERGAITIVQDRESSVVHGMAGEAIQLDAASYVLPPDKIAAALAALVKPS
ncbi:MAG: chemotaxis response regulator protein-glutamate methylesterase [Chloroflexi bacterium HGW-Chloroflexi-3]|nr:MAG: chemotaxis response regulator protein-glutamate methylesterase [Chloroflexi bacterium HGW-Chloroflexi-3]